MTKSTITRERAQQIFLGNGPEPSASEERELARMALAAMDSEPVAWTWHYREQWHVTNDERRAEFVAKDGDVAVLPLYLHAQQPVVPDGYVMVPKEPTKEMIDAGWLYYMGTKNPSSKGTYKSMIAAAPQSPGSDPATVPGKWIPVSEQMPEIRKGWLDTPVIIAVLGEKDGAEAMYCSDGKFRWGPDEQPINDVTHWMPLPAAPLKVK